VGLVEIPDDFGFTEDHEILRDSARRFLEERCPIQEVRRLADDPLGHDPAVWREMAQLGWMGLALPEEHGGAGLGYLHQALLLEEMGRRLLPSPYLGTVLAGLALLHTGDADAQARCCPALASGEQIATLALTEPEPSWEPGDVSATAEPADGGFALDGVKTHVLAAASADLVVSPFRTPDGIALFVIEKDAGGLKIEEEVGTDPTRRTGRLVFDDVRVGADARLDGDGLEALRRTLAEGAALLAAEMVGAAETVLVMTRDYAVARKQFDRQIGSFQAVKHPLVDVMIGVELARSHAYGAAAAFDQPGAWSDTRARMAKALASDVFANAVRRGVQFHGGYGFTIDCDMHFFFKRALASRAMLGDATHHRRHLARELFDAARD
jgi:alkylation response protein AidB-like acyl-CoA dehydrogenase